MAFTTHCGRRGGPLSVIIGAGGTGGHIYPGLAVADALRRADPDVRISFVGTRRGLETRLIPEAGHRLHTVDMIPFDRSLGAGRYLLPAALLRSGLQVRELIRRQDARVVLGMGGYPSAPAVLGARLAGLPSVIHESNAVPGRANRFAARLTPNLALAFDHAAAGLPRRTATRIVGMPIARTLGGLDRDALRAPARRAFGMPDGRALVLVNGGSLGAARLTAAALELAARWRHRTDVALLIKTGPDGLSCAQEQLAATGGSAVAAAVPYLDRMDLAYAAADLAVCRAGSATVAELQQVRLPAVLVPYPHAPHDHQTHNARLLSAAGAGVLLPDAAVTADALAGVVDPLVRDPARRAAMSAAGPAADHARAADRLASWLCELADRHAH